MNLKMIKKLFCLISKIFNVDYHDYEISRITPVNSEIQEYFITQTCKNCKHTKVLLLNKEKVNEITTIQNISNKR